MNKNWLAAATMIVTLLLTPTTLHADTIAMPPGFDLTGGDPILVWGRTTEATAVSFELCFGDEGALPCLTGPIADIRDIGATHVYAKGDFTATLTVLDASATELSFDEVEIKVRDVADFPLVDLTTLLDFQTNIAIEKGLRRLYLTQNVAGWWIARGHSVAPTALAVLAFENQGHPIKNLLGDTVNTIYTQTVVDGLDWMLSVSRVVTVGAHGNFTDKYPEASPNGTGIACHPDHSRHHAFNYEQGNCIDALVASGDKDRVAAASAGSTIPGMTYEEIVREMVDFVSWSQNDSASNGLSQSAGSGGSPHNGEGGFFYNFSIVNGNGPFGDTSASQWPVLGLLAAEKVWGITARPFVKTALEKWTKETQLGSGEGTYRGPNQHIHVSPGIATTASWMVEMVYLGENKGFTDNDRDVSTAIEHIDSHWNDYNPPPTNDNRWGTLRDNFYGQYAVFKAFNLMDVKVADMPSGRDWYNQPSDANASTLDGIRTQLVASQNSVGSWFQKNESFRTNDHLTTATGVLMLAPTVILGLPPPNSPPTADLTAQLEVECAVEAIALDASGSSDPDEGDTLTYAFSGPGTITQDTEDPSMGHGHWLAAGNIHVHGKSDR